jgi:hypothetical protein
MNEEAMEEKASISATSPEIYAGGRVRRPTSNSSFAYGSDQCEGRRRGVVRTSKPETPSRSIGTMPSLFRSKAP